MPHLEYDLGHFIHNSKNKTDKQTPESIFRARNNKQVIIILIGIFSR